MSLPAASREVPRALFPEKPPPARHLSRSEAPIGVQDLPAPAATVAGLPGAQAELAGPLWARGAPPEITELLRLLPLAIDEPTLRALQRDLLAAPGPDGMVPDGLLGLRVDRLLAMGEAETALELLALAPPAAAPDLDALRLRAQFAAGQATPACETLGTAPAQNSPWAEVGVVCAALARDAMAVEIALDRFAVLDLPLDPNLAGLARAAVAGARFKPRPPVADDAILLPLLRSVPLDLDATTVAALPVPARRAVAANPGIASAARAAATPTRPGPSIRSELNGVAPADWAAALASVPPEQRARWAALVDGLGAAMPDAIWSELSRAALSEAGPAPSLYLWRGFERASLEEQRGTMLLFVLLLLDGRPEAAAPVTLRRALDALLALGLERDARALAAGVGGALGL